MPEGRWSVRHYRAIHHHIFQDVYPWAGRLRTVRIAKGDSVFCYPERIGIELRRTFETLRQNDVLRRRDRTGFAAGAARFLADLNAIHAFRDGNGRRSSPSSPCSRLRPDIPISSGWIRPRSCRP